MKILVCGGREFDDFNLLDKTLDEYLWDVNEGWPIWITGGAKGADFLTRVWVKMRFTPSKWKDFYREYKADWKAHGKVAGFIRNQQMLDEEKPNLVIAFPGGKGTANMVKLAREAGVKVVEVEGLSS